MVPGKQHLSEQDQGYDHRLKETSERNQTYLFSSIGLLDSSRNFPETAVAVLFYLTSSKACKKMYILIVTWTRDPKTFEKLIFHGFLMADKHEYVIRFFFLPKKKGNTLAEIVRYVVTTIITVHYVKLHATN